MKKETRVMDLPQILQDLLVDKIGHKVKSEDNAKEWLDKIDWQKCSNEERLVFAELMYPVGTEIKSTIGSTGVTSSLPKMKSNSFVCEEGFIYADTIIPEGISNLEIYDFDRNNWAQILSTPEEKPEESQSKSGHDMSDFKEMCVAQDKSKCLVEFKEGEMVDVYTKGEWCEVEYAFFVGGKHWFYNVNFKEKDTVHVADEIRKLDPDREFQDMAKEIMKKAKGHDIPYFGSMLYYSESDVQSMLLEMGKRVKNKIG